MDEALDRLEAAIQEEGERVLSAIRGAVRALADADCELADEVIAHDDDVDELFLEIERSIRSLLALQTPVARDLRLLLALLHINLLLERTGDGCVTIAKLTQLVADAEPDAALVEVLVEMGERAEEMLRVALDSLARRDLAGAESLVELDELIDRANRRFVERLVDVMAEPVCANGDCAWSSSRGRSSASAIAPSTSASRLPICSPESSASSRTRPTRLARPR